MFQKLFRWVVEGKVRLMRWQVLGAYKCLMDKFGPQRRPALLVSAGSAVLVFMVARCILQVMCLLAAPLFFHNIVGRCLHTLEHLIRSGAAPPSQMSNHQMSALSGSKAMRRSVGGFLSPQCTKHQMRNRAFS